MLDYVSIIDFGAVSDGITDNYQAIMDAITASSAIYIPGTGTYYCSKSIQLKKTVRIYGDGAGMSASAGNPASTNGAIIKFPAGISTGICVNRHNTLNGDTVASGGAADGSIIEGITLLGQGGAIGHGIWLRARAIVRNVLVVGFSGNGYNLVATSGAGGSIEGNINGWRIEGCASLHVGKDGLYVNGNDANAGYCYGFDSEYSGGWSIQDASFLGNTYVACQSAECGLGSYTTISVNAQNLFLNCYSEQGQNNSFAALTMVIGGNIFGAKGNGSTLFSQYGIFQAKGFSVGNPQGPGNWIKLSNDGTAGSMQIGIGNYNYYDFHLDNKATLDMRFDYLSNSGYVAYFITGPNTSFKGGTDVVQPLQFIPSQSWIGGYNTNGRRHSYSSSAPTTGSHGRGEIVWNVNADAGGFAGWICIAKGTPGTWKTFGAISI